MKKEYTEDEYKSIIDISDAPESTAASQEKHAVSRQEYERRKKIQAENKEEGRRALHIVLYSCALFFLLCLIISGVSVALKNNSAKNDEKEKNETVITIAGEEIGADLFTLFCANVIEGSEFEYLMKTSMNDSALCASVKEKAVRYAEDYVCFYKEAQALGIKLSNEELELLRKACKEQIKPEGTDPDEYYRTNYGISFDGYVKMRANWVLADKYTTMLRNSCDTSEAELKRVYEANYSRFAKADVTMVYFDTSSTDSGANGFVKSTAEKIFNDLRIENTGYYTADNELLLTAVKEQSSKNEFFDIGASADGKATVTGNNIQKYPNLYEAVISMKIGEVRLVHDKTATFIVRCDAQYLFDSVKDSEELKLLTEELYVKEQYHAVRYSGRYDAEINSEYRALDISEYVSEGKKHYGR